MTNFQAQDPKPWFQTLLTRERVLLGVPVLVGGLAALGTGLLLVLPSWQKLSADQAELARLKALAATVPQYRRQIDQAEQRQRNAQQLQSRLMSMIAGSGDISTFMSQLGAEASRSGVLLDRYEPAEAAAAQPGSAPAQPGSVPAPPGGQAPPAGKAPALPDPLLAPGLKKTDLLITAHGSAPNLLTFLRRLEALSLLVVQSDLSLKQEESASSVITLKLKVSLYSKQTAAPAPLPPKPARS